MKGTHHQRGGAGGAGLIAEDAPLGVFPALLLESQSEAAAKYSACN